MINTRDAEPWAFGEEAEQIARNYIRFRYQLMPYIYSLFHEAATTGMPVQRSLSIYWPFDARVFDHRFHNQYLFGPNLLVCPAESTRDVVRVFLPEGDWYSIFTGQRYNGNQEVFIESPEHRLPVFARGGSILPMKRAGKNTTEGKDVLILHIYHGSNNSSFSLYEDDGETFNYQNGESSKRTLSFNSLNSTISLTKSEGSFTPSWKTISLVFHGFGTIGHVNCGQKRYEVESKEQSYFTPIEKYDPINDPEWMGSEKVQVTGMPFSSDELLITF